MDLAGSEPLPELFAVRFKLEDTSRLFYNKFLECQSALKVPTATQSDSDLKEVKEKEEQEIVEDEESGEEEEYGDMKESIMFEKSCTLSYLEGTSNEKIWILLGQGDIKIVYDEEMLCCRITVQDGNQKYLCDNVIAIETELKVIRNR